MSLDTVFPKMIACTLREDGSACASAQSDQSLCRALFAQLRIQSGFEPIAKTLISMRGSTGLSESLLGAYAIFKEKLCTGSVLSSTEQYRSSLYSRLSLSRLRLSRIFAYRSENLFCVLTWKFSDR